jgi:hypothetical protein
MTPDLGQALRTLGRVANVIDKPARGGQQADPDDNPAPHEQRRFGAINAGPVMMPVMMCVSHEAKLPRRPHASACRRNGRSVKRKEERKSASGQ